jgi:uncharacterized membrane protein YfcA
MAAGCVRGYGGFGFSMITVAGLSMVLPVDQIVPMVLMLEVGASLYLLPGVWAAVTWPVLAWMLLGVATGTPVGVWLLGSISPVVLKLCVAVIIFMLALLLRREFVLRHRPDRLQTLLTGAVSGTLNGAAAIGGPPAILFFFSSPTGASVSRASLIAYFLVTDLLAAGTCMMAGLITRGHVRQALILVLPMVAGLLIGKRGFQQTSEKRFRQRVLLCLMLLSLMTAARAIGEIV